MNIRLTGSEARYTIEQLCQMLLPSAEGLCDCRVSKKNGFVYAVCHMTGPCGMSRGNGRCRLTGDGYRDVNLERRTLARAVYRAVLGQLSAPPAWGMLSGVRPAKLIRSHLLAGGTLSGAEHFLEKAYFVSPQKAGLCAETGKIAYEVGKSLSEDAYSLYVHIPFCPSRCSYCSFISAAGDAFQRWGEAYFSMLCRELEMLGKIRNTGRMAADSVYVGGGTPAVYTAEQLSRLCDSIADSCGGIPGEFTVEAGRPDAITADKVRALYRGGVTRICVNPQTMHNETLRRIGRAHTADDVRRAFALARDVGFEEINCDLIAGLPGEDPGDFESSLREILALGPENITVHTLAEKRGSSFHEQHAAVSPASVLSEMLGIAESLLRGAGYSPYYLYRQKYTGGGFENIGWAKPGHVCRYNVVMMEEIGNILSAGAGAVTKLTTRAFTRFTNPKYPAEYIAAEGFSQRETALRQYFGI